MRKRNHLNAYTTRNSSYCSIVNSHHRWFFRLSKHTKADYIYICSNDLEYLCLFYVYFSCLLFVVTHITAEKSETLRERASFAVSSGRLLFCWINNFICSTVVYLPSHTVRRTLSLSMSTCFKHTFSYFKCIEMYSAGELSPKYVLSMNLSLLRNHEKRQ